MYTRHVHKPTMLPRLAFVRWPTNLGYSCFETRILRLQLNRADLETNTPSSNFEGFKEGSTYRGSKPPRSWRRDYRGWMDGWMDGWMQRFLPRSTPPSLVRIRVQGASCGFHVPHPRDVSFENTNP